MTERPILMTVESVLGILANAKSQTRRTVNWKVRPESEGINLSAHSLELGFYCTGVPSDRMGVALSWRTDRVLE